VKLPARNDDPVDGYINANYINTSRGERVFIAAQGPLPTSRENFWRMIVQEKVKLIVMLTGLKENGKVKCD
jgi:receptor-type tyrosine-protein phosphatase O